MRSTLEKVAELQERFKVYFHASTVLEIRYDSKISYRCFRKMFLQQTKHFANCYVTEEHFIIKLTVWKTLKAFGFLLSPYGQKELCSILGELMPMSVTRKHDRCISTGFGRK
jgi:hypothetical protein